MSLEAVKQVTLAEEQGRTEKAQAAQEAKSLIAEAERIGRQAVQDAQTGGDALAKQMLAQAEENAADEIARIRAQAVADADKLRSRAEGRLEEAASLIVRKVVDA